MAEYTQGELDEMVGCEKVIVDPPRKDMQSDRGCLRNDFTVESVDGRYKFKVFIRISKDFAENFSVGLDLLAIDGSRLPVLRCNGAHEGMSDISTHPVGNHSGCHIHRMSAEDLFAGVMACRTVEKTREYATLDEALRYFVKLCNITGAQQYFPDLHQGKLFYKNDRPNPA